MGDVYSPVKSNGMSLTDTQLCEAIVRADLYQRFDFWTGTVYLYSNNQAEPLTDLEKSLLMRHLVSRIPSLKVVFEDCKYPLDIFVDEPLPDWPKENPHVNTPARFYAEDNE